MQGETGGRLTAGALRQALVALPEETEVVAYADWEGVGERPFGLLEERMRICGYFSVTEAARDEEPTRVVIVLGCAIS